MILPEMREARMKPVFSSFFYSASFALLTIGQALGATSGGAPAVAGRGEEEVSCIGPGSITGTVVDAKRIITPHFSAYQCSSHYPVYISVQFKDPSTAMTAGDTVTLKGRLIAVQDAQRNEQGFVLKNAEIVP
jgi:hypothetical protein